MKKIFELNFIYFNFQITFFNSSPSEHNDTTPKKYELFLQII